MLAKAARTAWRNLPPAQQTEMTLMMNGWKTYLAALAAIVSAWAAWSQGALDLAQAFQATITAVLAATVRHGVSTTANGGGK